MNSNHDTVSTVSCQQCHAGSRTIQIFVKFSKSEDSSYVTSLVPPCQNIQPIKGIKKQIVDSSFTFEEKFLQNTEAQKERNIKQFVIKNAYWLPTIASASCQ